MKRNLSPREINILIVSIIMAVAFAITQLVVRPLQQYHEMLDEDILQRTRELKNDQKKWKNAAASSAKFKKYERLLGKAQDDDEQMGAFVATIQQAATTAGINLQNLQAVKVPPGTVLKRFSVQMTVDGPWQSMTEFFYILQSQPHYAILDELTLERSTGQGKNNVRGRVLLSQLKLHSF
jgi:Tfp pilus assembly protein PilO